MTDITSNTKRLVLGDDTVICRHCYEPQVLELDARRVPIGETDQLPCSICGANDAAAAQPARPVASVTMTEMLIHRDTSATHPRFDRRAEGGGRRDRPL